MKKAKKEVVKKETEKKDETQIFLVLQQIVNKEFIEGETFNINTSVVVRKVEAKSKEEALAVYYIQTGYISAVKKLEPICIVLSEIPMLITY